MKVRALPKKPKILLIRPDRIGDVVLSLPVVQALRSRFPESEISFLARPYVLPVLERVEGISETLIYQPDSTHQGIAGLRKLASEIRQRKFDVAICLQVQAWPTLAAKMAGVPVRIGPLSKWYSKLCFTDAVFQKRSAVDEHEAQYGLDLLQPLGIHAELFNFRPKLQGRELNTRPGYIVVHAGMGGSALNLSEDAYKELVRILSQKSLSVVLTGSEQERPLVERIQAKLPGVSTRISPASNEGLRDLLKTIEGASAVVAPSTGPLHLASALGRPTVSFFPPIRVQSANRWGPVPHAGGRSFVFTPKAACEETFSCAGDRCAFHFCMDEITPMAIAERVEQLIAVTKSRR